MPHSRRTLSLEDVVRLCGAAFTPNGSGLFGLEMEWPVWGGPSADGRATAEVVSRLEGAPLPAGGRLTFEPGGQVELSGKPQRTIGAALSAARTDAQAIQHLFKAEGYVCRTTAVDVLRAPRRILDRPRYRAMESFFGASGQAGTWMMCNTASTQVNVSHAEHDPFERWHLLSMLSPVLLACFANSPGLDGSGQRWASLRQGIWASIDPSRTRAVVSLDETPAQAWASYALAADVMLIGAVAEGGPATPVSPGLTLAHWVDAGHPAGWPTEEDVRYHVTTLFPPVRPRGWLEVRVVDALPAWLREACALVVATACLPEASRELLGRIPDTRGLEIEAARHGMAHPLLAEAATHLINVVSDHVGALTADPEHLAVLDEFSERYVHAGRCPADDGTRIRIPVSLTAAEELVAV